MAKAITQIERRIPNPAEQQAQALDEVMEKLVQHKEAVVTFLDVLGAAHEAGLLDLAKGALENRTDIGRIGIHQLNKPGARRLVRNGMSALTFLTKLDPEMTETTLHAVAHGVEQAGRAKQTPKQAGLWGAVKSMRDPEVNASVAFLMNLLRGMGEKLPRSKQ